MILPSLLEYSKKELESKLAFSLNQIDKFKNTANQSGDQISLHLDFVLEGFANNRKVPPSLDLQNVFEVLKKQPSSFNFDLSIHLMGTDSDLLKSQEFFRGLDLISNFNATVFVPKPFFKAFSDIGKTKKKFKTGIWLDLNDWNQEKIESQEAIKEFLLMTVLAGKSGQKLIPEVKQKALELVKNNPNKNFILDGGWSLSDLQHSFKNLKMVSYSSFWKVFLA